MMKKIIPILLCFTLLFSVSVFAVNSETETSENTVAVTGEMPQQQSGNGQGKGRFGMGNPPQRGDMQNGDMPSMPPGDMPSGEMPSMPSGEMSPNRMTPPQNGESATQDGTQQTPDGSSDQTFAPRDDMKGFSKDFMTENAEDIEDTEATQEQSATGIVNFLQTYSTPITALVLLLLAFIFVMVYKRKRF